MDSKEQKIYYRRKLPHFHPLYATFFVTFRLAGSLPAEVIARLREEQQQSGKYFSIVKNNDELWETFPDKQKRYFAAFDGLLDISSDGPTWLNDVRIASLVSNAAQYRDGKEYDLLAYCIMPNHVHMVFSLLSTVGRRDSSPYIVTNILGSLKWYTALKANQILQRRGAFWQHESYDHVVRDGAELIRIVQYVLYNPVRAGLVESWEKWPWTYCKPGLFV